MDIEAFINNAITSVQDTVCDSFGADPASPNAQEINGELKNAIKVAMELALKPLKMYANKLSSIEDKLDVLLRTGLPCPIPPTAQPISKPTITIKPITDDFGRWQKGFYKYMKGTGQPYPTAPGERSKYCSEKYRTEFSMWAQPQKDAWLDKWCPI